MKSLQQSRIPLRMAVLNLVHELMHAFGAQHDPDAVERAECTPANSEEDGRFLMSKYSNNGRKHNHELVSPCTQQSVAAVLQSQTRQSRALQTSEVRDSLIGQEESTIIDPCRLWKPPLCHKDTAKGKKCPYYGALGALSCVFMA